MRAAQPPLEQQPAAAPLVHLQPYVRPADGRLPPQPAAVFATDALAPPLVLAIAEPLPQPAAAKPQPAEPAPKAPRQPFVPPTQTDELATKKQQAMAEAEAEGLTLERDAKARSGFKGVTQSSSISFRAVAYEGRKQRRLGCFPTAEQAALSYARYMANRCAAEASESHLALGLPAGEASDHASDTSSDRGSDVLTVSASPEPTTAMANANGKRPLSSLSSLSEAAPAAAAPAMMPPPPLPAMFATTREMSFESARACRGVCVICKHGLQRACSGGPNKFAALPPAPFSMHDLFGC